ncbi:MULTISPECIES: efflux RND transporter periplasmic adaptor subunit [Cohnella]|jgi:RND family efflux transporter MFP subunit|uniref:efflux RND transporter periplasmic adaptor subunit n=1 Tax=Cohnella TaxID=329857 RepID=UPI000E3ABE33|nr:efflux RND transporter periplasmic adaptor subunit [Cohnella sp.]REK67038.1 MAG: efflux RND transporter periplasmic adaptor subunit [Cohnella sp.]
MKKKSTWILILLVVLIALVTYLLFSLNRSAGQSAPPEAATANVIRLQATKEDIVNTIEVKGKSTYAEETWVYAPFASEVKAWKVRDGSQVAKGQVLFQLEDSALRDSIELAKANLRKQELDLKLSQMQKQVKEEEVETAEWGDRSAALEQYANSERETAEAELAEVQLDIARKELKANMDKLAKAQYKAPADGIFLFADTKEPKMVDTGAPLGKIVNTSKLRLISTVSEYEVFRIKPGMEVDIKVEALKQKKLKGVVDSVSKFAKAGTDPAQFEVVISLEASPDLIAGLSLVGTIQTDKKSGVVVVPTLAVMHEDSGYFVYLERNGAIVKQPVKIGLETPDKTEIVEGVREGDTVVLQ